MLSMLPTSKLTPTRTFFHSLSLSPLYYNSEFINFVYPSLQIQQLFQLIYFLTSLPLDFTNISTLTPLYADITKKYNFAANYINLSLPESRNSDSIEVFLEIIYLALPT